MIWKEKLKHNLVSVIVYGKIVRHELVVVKKIDQGVMDSIASMVKKRDAQVLSEAEIATSTDVFALEYLDMLQSYEVIFGKDVLRPIKLRKADVRHNLEYEFRSKLIALRDAYMRSRTMLGADKRIFKRAIPTLMPVLHGLLYLKGENIPAAPDDVIRAVQQVFDMDMTTLEELYNGTNNQNTLKGLLELLTKLAQECERL